MEGKKRKNANRPSVTRRHAKFLSCLFGISCDLFVHGGTFSRLAVFSSWVAWNSETLNGDTDESSL